VKEKSNTPTAKEDLRHQPLYSATEVGLYARVQPSIVSSWTRGNDGSAVVLPAAKNIVAPLSFINLIEFHVLVALRRDTPSP